MSNDRIQDYFNRTAQRFDAIYSGATAPLGRLWDRTFRRNIQWRHEFALEAATSCRKLRILDVGCGSGRLCVDLLRRGVEEVVGVDFSTAMLAIAGRLAREAGYETRCTFLLSDVSAYTPAQPFDVVIALGFFDYVHEPLRVMRQLRSLCNIKLIASFPRKWSPRAPLRKFWHRLNNSYVRLYTNNAVDSLLNLSGFERLRLVKRGPIYVVVAAKSDSWSFRE